MACFLLEPGFQALASLRIKAIMLEPFHSPTQQRVGDSKRQFRVPDERAGKIGRILSTIGQDIATLLDDMGGLQPDQRSASDGDQRRSRPAGRDATGAIFGPGALLRVSTYEHSRRNAE